MSAFEQRLLKEIENVMRNTGAPARTKALSGRTATPESTVRWWLRKAEAEGYVQRRGQRGGWLPGTAAPAASAYMHA